MHENGYETGRKYNAFLIGHTYINAIEPFEHVDGFAIFIRNSDVDANVKVQVRYPHSRTRSLQTIALRRTHNKSKRSRVKAPYSAYPDQNLIGKTRHLPTVNY